MTELRKALRRELARHGGRATLAELEILHAGTPRNTLIAELAAMRDAGEVSFDGPRYNLDWRQASSPSSDAHEHHCQGQTLRHSHQGGRTPHGYFDHPEDAGSPHEHSAGGPAGCSRCQLARDTAGVDWAAAEAAAQAAGAPPGGTRIEIDHAEVARVARDRLREELGEPGCGNGMQVQEHPGPGRYAAQPSALAVEPRNVELSASRRVKLLDGWLGLDPATRADLLELVEHWAFGGFIDPDKSEARKILQQMYDKGGLK